MEEWSTRFPFLGSCLGDGSFPPVIHFASIILLCTALKLFNDGRSRERTKKKRRPKKRKPKPFPRPNPGSWSELELGCSGWTFSVQYLQSCTAPKLEPGRPKTPPPSQALPLPGLSCLVDSLLPAPPSHDPAPFLWWLKFWDWNLRTPKRDSYPPRGWEME